MWFEPGESLVVEVFVAEVCRKEGRVAPVSTMWQKSTEVCLSVRCTELELGHS